jgi:hypothetical protein
MLMGLGWAGSLRAQSMQSLTTYRQLHGDAKLAAKLEFSAGQLKVRPSRATDLYRMTLSYDSERFAPLSHFDVGAGIVTLGVEPAGRGGLRVVSSDQMQQLAAVELSPRVDLALDVALGATEADFDLGGLRVSQLKLQTGASRTTLHFSRPNGIRCTGAEISSGAGEVVVTGLANSRCDEIAVEGGMGRVTLDFGGTLAATQRAAVRMAVGELVLRLPKGVPVRLTTSRFLAEFEPKGLVRRGNAWETPGYNQSARHLEVALTAAVGGIKLEWTD